jgi:hypothetical protein
VITATGLRFPIGRMLPALNMEAMLAKRQIKRHHETGKLMILF